jgi:ligand-binding sensor domain-containing protein
MRTILTTFLLLLVKIAAPYTVNIVTPSSLPSGEFGITAFGENDKYIYIGTDSGVIIHNKRNGRLQFLTQRNSDLPSDQVTSIACTEDGQVYIGTKKGILLWDNFVYLRITSENSHLPDNHITAMVADRNGELWIGTCNEGLVIATANPIKPFRLHPIQTNNENIHSISIDPHGDLWVAFQNGGFACLRNGVWNTFSSSQSITNVKFNNTGRFMFDISCCETYFCNGYTFEKIEIDSTYQTRTCSYYNPKYSRMILFYSDGVYVFNWLDPFSVPKRISSGSFIHTLFLK